MVGAYAAYADVSNLEMALGDFIAEEDTDELARVSHLDGAGVQVFELVGHIRLAPLADGDDQHDGGGPHNNPQGGKQHLEFVFHNVDPDQPDQL